MLFKSVAALAVILPAAFACPDEMQHLRKRDTSAQMPEWTYGASYDWGRLDHMYADCQTGTQQSPIALSLRNGLSSNHIPSFHNYDRNVTGKFYNWGYGPAFKLSKDDLTSNPSLSYDNETLYLLGWHIHSPADHLVEGERSKSEMHFVHANAEGHEKAVLAFRIDPGNSDAAFFSQLPTMMGFNETGTEYEHEATMDLSLALDSVLHFNEFWSYAGSLTSPPCREGIRWFVARQIMFVGVKQMQTILGASSYSARVEQQVWQHRINE
jgi:carbonic anhydrase